MLTFGDMQRECQRRCRDTSTDSLTFFKQNLIIGQQILESEINTFVTERTQTFTTVAATNTYNLPDKFIRLRSLYVTIGTQRYNAVPVYDENLWQKFQSTTSVTGDQIQRVFVRRNTFEIFPTPSAGTYTMTMIFEAESQPMSFDDYTTGTVTTLAAAGTTVTGSGTSWTANMAGRFFKIDAEPTWYEISAATTTSITLRSPFQGTAISAGSSAYTIGEMPRTPSATHIIPVLYACWNYYQGAQKDAKFGAIFKKQYEDMTNWAKATYAKRYASNVIPSQRQLRQGLRRLNINWFPDVIN